MRFWRGDDGRFVAGVFYAALALIAVPPESEAQPARRPTIGWLSYVPSPTESRWMEDLRQRLEQLGHRGIVIEIRSAQGDPKRLSEAAAELVRVPVDLIVVFGGSQATRAVKEITATIPIVMYGGSDPVRAGLVASLARPGGNVTGVTTVNVELTGKRLALLKETSPQISRVAVLAQAGSPTVPLSLGDAEAAARSLGIQLHVLQISGPADLDSAFVAAERERAGAILLVSGPLLLTASERIAALAARKGLPSASPYREFAELGGLMSYGADRGDFARRVAELIDKILKGARPADLPVEQPTKFELVINLRTAKALGLAIPASVLARADEIIE